MVKNIKQCKELNNTSKSQFQTYNAYFKMPVCILSQIRVLSLKSLPAKDRKSLTGCEY